MQTDYIDLFQIHTFDAMTPVEETLATLDDLVASGKIRYIGCSNFSGWHLMKSIGGFGALRLQPLRGASGVLFADRTRLRMGADAIGHRARRGRGCLESARLGAFDRQDPARQPPPPAVSRLQSQAVVDKGPVVPDEYLYNVVDAIDEVAKETGKSVPQIALNWLLQRPTVANVIVGARNEEQLRQNLGAVGWNLTSEQIAKLDAASAVTPAYPYWHQRTNPERNPPPV